ncbi:hypothetical protein AW736_21275 [Termitidicoccus mucosus]|uniref:Uncharacterized protein n=1 Tax=Termitidicoccus mucosus TaxID=1184151 RepID=A0A178IEI9_9BACT|nr:hypothetical protein AW736_21275 [Opitutaceae bacterium TSB47]
MRRYNGAAPSNAVNSPAVNARESRTCLPCRFTASTFASGLTNRREPRTSQFKNAFSDVWYSCFVFAEQVSPPRHAVNVSGVTSHSRRHPVPWMMRPMRPVLSLIWFTDSSRPRMSARYSASKETSEAAAASRTVRGATMPAASRSASTTICRSFARAAVLSVTPSDKDRTGPRPTLNRPCQKRERTRFPFTRREGLKMYSAMRIFSDSETNR